MVSRYTLVAACIGLLIIGIALGTDESTSLSGPPARVDSLFFGMHIHHAAEETPWPPVDFGTWRLWDAGVSWPQVEPKPGVWNFALLDRYVQLASEHHVELLLTLGLTPTWASARPNEPSAYATGNAAEPRHIADWENYVRTVATRYKGTIHAYEIWNEPNVKGTFTGDTAAMMQLTEAAYRVLKSVDPTIIVVSPAATTEDGIEWLNQFLQLQACQYVDVIGYHMYVTPDPPEAMISLINNVRASLRVHGCNKPLWNTESGWSRPKRFTSEQEAAAYLIRTFILNWLLGIQRCYWYAWDNHNWSTLELTSAPGHRPTAAGSAYGVVHRWMLGSRVESCRRQPTGVWICQLERGGHRNWLVWSEISPRPFDIPRSWQIHTITNWQGAVQPMAPQVTADAAPIFISGK